MKQMLQWHREGNLSYLNKFATKNVSWIPAVVSGKCKVHLGKIDHFTESGVVLKDGTTLALDAVVYCTGYVDRFPFIVDPALRPKDNDVRNLFRHAFSPEAGPTMCYIGFVRPTTGAIPACSELTSRLFAQIVSGNVRLPANLPQLIATEKAKEEAMFYNSLNVKTVVNPTDWMDSMAKLIGCYTHPLTHWSNPITFLRWQVCASLPARYRLVGPGADPEKAWAWMNKALAQSHLSHVVILSIYKVAETLKYATGDLMCDYRKWTGGEVQVFFQSKR